MVQRQARADPVARPHDETRLEVQGLGNELIAPTVSVGTGPVTCRARLGGVLKFYDREAA